MRDYLKATSCMARWRRRERRSLCGVLAAATRRPRVLLPLLALVTVFSITAVLPDLLYGAGDGDIGLGFLVDTSKSTVVVQAVSERENHPRKSLTYHQSRALQGLNGTPASTRKDSQRLEGQTSGRNSATRERGLVLKSLTNESTPTAAEIERLHLSVESRDLYHRESVVTESISPSDVQQQQQQQHDDEQQQQPQGENRRGNPGSLGNKHNHDRILNSQNPLTEGFVLDTVPPRVKKFGRSERERYNNDDVSDNEREGVREMSSEEYEVEDQRKMVFQKYREMLSGGHRHTAEQPKHRTGKRILSYHQQTSGVLSASQSDRLDNGPLKRSDTFSNQHLSYFNSSLGDGAVVDQPWRLSATQSTTLIPTSLILEAVRRHKMRRRIQPTQQRNDEPQETVEPQQRNDEPQETVEPQQRQRKGFYWDSLNRVLHRDNTGNGSRGFVMAMDYFEQQTSAARNMQSLQCWAAENDLSVVEPAVVGSFFEAPLGNETPIEFWFHDLYDLAEWNRDSYEWGYSKLVRWADFLKSAPRDVILVDFKHIYPRDLVKDQAMKPVSQRKLRNSHPMRLWEGCTTEFFDSTEAKLKRHNFTVVQHICFNFGFGDPVTRMKFLTHIYGRRLPSQTTVVFSQWKGITARSSRVFIQESDCDISLLSTPGIGPSKKLLNHVREYQRRYIGTGPYLAVVVRIEKVHLLMNRKAVSHKFIGHCFKTLLSVLRGMRSRLGTSRSVLAIDMGKYGSNTFRNTSKEPYVERYFQSFFSGMFGDEFTVNEWEESFSNVTGTTDSGYTAALQKWLAVRASCLLFMGGGSFQRHIYSLHAGRSGKDCIVVIRECTHEL